MPRRARTRWHPIRSACAGGGDRRRRHQWRPGPGARALAQRLGPTADGPAQRLAPLRRRPPARRRGGCRRGGHPSGPDVELRGGGGASDAASSAARAVAGAVAVRAVAGLAWAPDRTDAAGQRLRHARSGDPDLRAGTAVFLATAEPQDCTQGAGRVRRRVQSRLPRAQAVARGARVAVRQSLVGGHPVPGLPGRAGGRQPARTGGADECTDGRGRGRGRCAGRHRCQL